jgi:L-ascorbate metabolism protein UlaG (beta-lactamase superfamily)
MSLTRSPARAQKKLLYLREDVRVEPLIGGFRAWTQLIPPHTHAINLVAKHIPALQARAPTSAEAAELLDATLDGQADVIALARAIDELDRLLAERADGRSLDPLYAEVPKPLRGYVELVYDRAGRPSARFLEGLLYAAPLAHRELQSVEVRPLFVDEEELPIRQPRLPRTGVWQGPLPFASPEWDRLARARVSPLSRADVEELDGDRDVLAPFFVPEAPRRADRAPGVSRGLRARFFGHACVLFQSAHSNVLVDPLIVPRPRGASGRRSFSQLPDRLDCILITHGHMDHLDIETLLQLRHRTRTVIVPKNRTGDLLDPSLGLILRSLGFDDVRELQEMECVTLTDGEVVAVPFLGEHADLDIAAKSAYAVTLGGRTALCTADARNHEPEVFAHVRRTLGPVHAGFLGMECEGSPLSLAHGPFLTAPVPPEIDESRRTNGNDSAGALAMIDALECPAAYVYAMGFETWLAFMFGVPDETRTVARREIATFLDGCRSRGVGAELLEGPRDITV